MEKITGKISYITFFKFENLSKENIKESLTDTKNVEDFNITKGFINISPFEPKRMYSYNIETGLTNTKTSELSIFANVYDSVDIVEAIVNLTFKEASTDDITFLHHILYKGNTIIDDKKSIYDGLNIDGITNRVIEELGIKQESLHKELTTIVELNDCENAATTLQKYENDINIKKELYGMFVGDEGYKNVPEALVNERIVNIWSSRDFVSFFAFQNKFLIINLINSDERKKYKDLEDKFQNKYHGALNKYFTFDPRIAGLNHGFLNSIENVFVVKTLAKSYFTKINLLRKKNKNYKESIASIKTNREELELVLSNFDKIGIAELGMLEYKIIEKVQVIPLIDEIKYMLELVESKLDAEYSERTSIKVDVLTVLSIIISLVALIYTILDHLG